MFGRSIEFPIRIGTIGDIDTRKHIIITTRDRGTGLKVRRAAERANFNDEPFRKDTYAVTRESGGTISEVPQEARTNIGAIIKDIRANRG